MQFVKRNRLMGCNLLFLVAILLTGLYAYDSVTYIASATKEKCKGIDLDNCCKTGQNGVAKISDNKSLEEVKKVINDTNEYWTSLSFSKEIKKYCWNQNLSDCFEKRPEAIDQSSLKTTSGKVKDWNCFVVQKKNGIMVLREKPCDSNRRYICVKDTPKSPEVTLMESRPVSTQLETTINKGSIKTTTLEITTSGALKLTAITAQQTPTAEIEVPATKTTTATSVALFVTMQAPIVNTVLRSSMLARAKTNISETSTAIFTSSVAYVSNRNTSTQEKQNITTQLTPTKEVEVATTRKTTIVSSAGLFTPTTTPTLIVNTVLTSSMLTSAGTKIGESSTVTSTSSVAYDSNNNRPIQGKQTITTHLTTTKGLSAAAATTRAGTVSSVNTVLMSSMLTTAYTVLRAASTVPLKSAVTNASSENIPFPEEQTAEKLFLQYLSGIRTLNAGKEVSLEDAANIVNNFLTYCNKSQPKKSDLNILIATRGLESIALKHGKIHLKANESMVISKEFFDMTVQKISANNKEAVTFSVNEANHSAIEGRGIISLPPGIAKGHEAVVVNIMYNGIAKCIPREENVELDGKTLTSPELGSRIISSTVDPKPTGILQENVTIMFTYNKEVGKSDIPHCVFWDFAIKSKWNGSWSSKGCSLVEYVDKEITCTCNHLTNFAVLMQIGGNEVLSEHKIALEVITYVGCALSLVGEGLTIIAYCALMNLKEEQIQIRFNLVVAIAIAQFTFLAGIDASETEGVCVFVAALIHYFYLAGFAWMLFEGVYLYLMVVKVYNTEVRMRLFYAVAWGLSLLIVVLSIVIASSQDGGVQNYVHGDFCWVSFANNLIWTFVTPVLVVCLINSVILGLVIHEILTMQAHQTSKLERVGQGVKACVVLFPLLGMTWVFGVLSVTDAGLAFQYIFTILNSLQGFFIFIFHVLRNGDVRAAFFRKKQQWKHVNSIGASSAANHYSMDMRSKVVHDTEDSKNRSLVGYGSTVIMEKKRSMTPIDT